MQSSGSRDHWARWIVIAVAACFAAGGCQSVTTRGQQNPDLIPFPEAEQPDAEKAAEPLPSPQESVPDQFPSPPAAREATPPAETPAPPTAPGPSATSRKVAPPPRARIGDPPVRGAPSELCMTTLPAYRVEPPDVLLLEVLKLVPKPPYLIQPLDILTIVVNGTLLDQDIRGQFAVDPSGFVDLGPAYGRVHIAGQSTDDATTTIDTFLRRILSEPEVSVILAQTSGQQQVAGEHMIGPDGTINLGMYGSVFVAGLTVAEVKEAVEQQLRKYLQEPIVSATVFSYQSKFYYVISQGAGLGDGVTKVPITGKETVLDAIAQVNGLSRLSSKKMWIARPVPGGHGCDQVLPVNYQEITAGAASGTNYQLLPGDRLYLAEDKWIAADSFITKITAPFERIFGFSLLATNTIQNVNSFPLGNQGNNFF